VGYFSEAIDDLYLVDGVYGGREPTVDAKDLVVDNDRKCEEVKHVCKIVPHVGVPIFARALCVESVGLGYAAGLVVAADEVDSVGIAQLEAHEQRNGFDGEETAINVVA